VILVVGAETTQTICKGRVAEALAAGRGASEVETTNGGGRLFRRNSFTEIVVTDTTPLMSLLPAVDIMGLPFSVDKRWFGSRLFL
jgi:hypothetical protein